MIATSPSKVGISLTSRDLTVFGELNRWRCMRSEQIMAYFPSLFRSVSAVKERLSKLEAAGYVHGVNYGGRGNPTVWYARRKAVEACESPLSVTETVGYMRVSHTLGLVDLWIALRDRGGVWTTERELWQERSRNGSRSPVPDARWSCDGVVQAVELELSRKTPSLYDAKMKWAANPYNGALADGYTEVVYYTDRGYVANEVRAAIRRCRAEQMVRVESLPPDVRIRRWGLKGLDL